MPRYDARGLRMLPAFRDMHIHLDKTFDRPALSPLPRQGKTIMDVIAREEVLIPQLLPTSQERAEGLVRLLLSQGATGARSHRNIDPVSGLKSLEHLQAALAAYGDSFDCEIVAFPQHGLLHSKVDGLMRSDGDGGDPRRRARPDQRRWPDGGFARRDVPDRARPRRRRRQLQVAPGTAELGRAHTVGAAKDHNCHKTRIVAPTAQSRSRRENRLRDGRSVDLGTMLEPDQPAAQSPVHRRLMTACPSTIAR